MNEVLAFIAVLTLVGVVVAGVISIVKDSKNWYTIYKNFSLD